jgi:hypothetical protein
MKICCFLLFFTFISGCNSQNKAGIITISYEAITRGGSIEINATSELITYKDLENKKQLKPASSDWKNLIKLIEEINLSEMENFNPPSEDRYVDAALQATISITVDETTYNSQTFDHGNPPKELKKIIDQLFDIVSE